MVTGDNIQTAHAIAKECNIIDSTCKLKKLLRDWKRKFK